MDRASIRSLGFQGFLFWTGLNNWNRILGGYYGVLKTKKPQRAILASIQASTVGGLMSSNDFDRHGPFWLISTGRLLRAGWVQSIRPWTWFDRPATGLCRFSYSVRLLIRLINHSSHSLGSLWAGFISSTVPWIACRPRSEYYHHDDDEYCCYYCCCFCCCCY